MIVHIGAPKAGSSAIQDFLRRNADRLERAGIYVPHNDLSPSSQIRTGSHVAFFDSLRPLDAAKVELFRERLDELSRLSRQRSLMPVISAENLIGGLDEQLQYPNLFAGIGDLFDVTVVIYVRRQDGFFVASWMQWNFKRHPDFRAWYQSRRGRLANWDAAVMSWEKVLPEAQFHVRVYDRRRLVGGDVVTDFLALLGLPPDDFERPSDPLVNRSLNEVAGRVMARNPHLFDGVHDHRFIDFLRAYGGAAATTPVNTGLFLNADERRALVDAYAESNERLRRRHLPELPPGGLFSDEYRETPMVDPQTLNERELDLLWSVLFAMHRQHQRRGDRKP